MWSFSELICLTGRSGIFGCVLESWLEPHSATVFCQLRLPILLGHLSCLAFPHSKALGSFGHTGSWTWKMTLKVHLVADVETNICVNRPLFLKTSGSWVSQGSTPWLAPRKVLRLTQDPFYYLHHSHLDTPSHPRMRLAIQSSGATVATLNSS